MFFFYFQIYIILSSISIIYGQTHWPQVYETVNEYPGFPIDRRKTRQIFNTIDSKKSKFNYQIAFQPDPQKQRYLEQQKVDALNQAKRQERLRKEQILKNIEILFGKSYSSKYLEKRIKRRSVEQQEDQNFSVKNYLGEAETSRRDNVIYINPNIPRNIPDNKIAALNALIGKNPKVQLLGLQAILNQHHKKDYTPITENQMDIANPNMKPNIKVEHRPAKLNVELFKIPQEPIKPESEWWLNYDLKKHQTHPIIINYNLLDENSKPYVHQYAQILPVYNQIYPVHNQPELIQQNIQDNALQLQNNNVNKKQEVAAQVQEHAKIIANAQAEAQNLAVAKILAQSQSGLKHDDSSFQDDSSTRVSPQISTHLQQKIAFSRFKKPSLYLQSPIGSTENKVEKQKTYHTLVQKPSASYEDTVKGDFSAFLQPTLNVQTQTTFVNDEIEKETVLNDGHRINLEVNQESKVLPVAGLSQGLHQEAESNEENHLRGKLNELNKKNQFNGASTDGVDYEGGLSEKNFFRNRLNTGIHLKGGLIEEVYLKGGLSEEIDHTDLLNEKVENANSLNEGKGNLIGKTLQIPAFQQARIQALHALRGKRKQELKKIGGDFEENQKNEDVSNFIFKDKFTVSFYKFMSLHLHENFINSEKDDNIKRVKRETDFDSFDYINHSANFSSKNFSDDYYYSYDWNDESGEIQSEETSLGKINYSTGNSSHLISDEYEKLEDIPLGRRFYRRKRKPNRKRRPHLKSSSANETKGRENSSNKNYPSIIESKPSFLNSKPIYEEKPSYIGNEHFYIEKKPNVESLSSYINPKSYHKHSTSYIRNNPSQIQNVPFYIENSPSFENNEHIILKNRPSNIKNKPSYLDNIPSSLSESKRPVIDNEDSYSSYVNHFDYSKYNTGPSDTLLGYDKYFDEKAYSGFDGSKVHDPSNVIVINNSNDNQNTHLPHYKEEIKPHHHHHHHHDHHQSPSHHHGSGKIKINHLRVFKGKRRPNISKLKKIQKKVNIVINKLKNEM